MAEDVLRAEALVKRFGSVKALNGLNLEVRSGRIFGLIGPNGAGKTTTIKIALGLLRADNGRMTVFGEDPWDNPRIRSQIGFLHEKPSFPKAMKGLEYLTRVARIYGMPNPEEVALKYLRLVGLEPAANRAIKGYSAGMVQRLGIAQALLPEPQLVILDEPTSNLDPQARSELLDLIYNLHRDLGVTFIISSHVLPELSKICDEVALIYRGRVYVQAAVDEVREKLALRVFRIMVDRPEDMIRGLEGISYIKNVSMRGRDIFVEVEAGHDYEIYRDVADVAERMGVALQGIESRVVGLEELFRRVVSGG